MELKNHKNLKVFYRFGFIYAEDSDDRNVKGMCPFCGKAEHFYIDVISNKKPWVCHHCGKSGGYPGFLQEVNAQCVVHEKCSIGVNARLTALSKNRGIQKETFRHFEVGVHPVTSKYILPVWDIDHTKLSDLATYDIDDKLMNAPGSNVALYGLWHLCDDEEIWLTGGQWDCMAMHEILEGRDNPLGSPGETTFKRSWIQFFENRVVNIIYDNDDSGTLGMQKIEHLLKDIPGQRRFIHWAKSFPRNGFDVRALYIKLKFNKKITLGVIKSMLRDKPPKGEKKIFNVPGSVDKITENGEIIKFNNNFKQKDKKFYNNFDPTQSWTAKYFSLVYGEMIRFNHTSRSWHIYNDKYWEKDITEGAINYIQQFISDLRDRYIVDLDIEEEKRKNRNNFLTQQLSYRNLESILKLARATENISVKKKVFDAHDHLINFKNGTYDLNKLLFRQHSHKDLITYCMDVDYIPSAECLYWEKFIYDTMMGDWDLIKFIQQLLGYCLSGYTNEQYLFFLFGKGLNGKSIFIKTLDMLYGPYFEQSNTELLMKKNNATGIPNDIAKLIDCRIAVTTETDDSKSFDTVKLKNLTGGDKMSARFLHQEWFTFDPKLKLFIVGNKKPKIKDQDYAVWRGMCLIPFMYHVPEDLVIESHVLLERFSSELSGILNWVLAGWKEYSVGGRRLKLPKAITESVKDYKDMSNPILPYLQERCFIGTTERDLRLGVSLKDLHADYVRWCKESEVRWFGKSNFGIKVIESGFRKVRGSNNTVYITGLNIMNKTKKYLKRSCFEK